MDRLFQVENACKDGVAGPHQYVKIQQSLNLYGRYRADARNDATHASEVRNLLQKHGLVWSMPDLPGRILVAVTVRRAAREVLKARDSELFARLQRSAQALRRLLK